MKDHLSYQVTFQKRWLDKTGLTCVFKVIYEMSYFHYAEEYRHTNMTLLILNLIPKMYKVYLLLLSGIKSATKCHSKKDRKYYIRYY